MGTGSLLVAGQRLDRATFHARYDATPPATRAELIGGVVQITPPPGFDHGDETVPVVVWLDHYAESTPGVRASINASVLLDDHGEPQPDVLLRILPEHGGQVRHEGGYIVGAPELVVEVARSTRFLDLGPKQVDYERAGVQEYVVVALDPDEVQWFFRRGKRLVEQPVSPDGLFRSEVFPGLWLDPQALLRADCARLRAVVDLGLASPEHRAFVEQLAQRRA